MSPLPCKVAVLADPVPGKALVDALKRQGVAARDFQDLPDFVKALHPGSVAVLVVQFRDGRPGHLEAWARMALEAPCVRKLAVLEQQPSLCMASYLTACSVEIVKTTLDEQGLERVAGMVRRMAAQHDYCLASPNP